MSYRDELPPLKEHQRRGLALLAEQRAKEPNLPALAVAPPGAGKSRCMIEQTFDELERGGTVTLGVHRKMLLEQLEKNFTAAGIDYGVIAADSPYEPGHSVYLASMQTLFSRGVRRGRIDLPRSSLLLIDEAHQQTGAMARAIVYGSFQDGLIQEGLATQGAYVVGYTATPLMSASIYQRLVPFGSYSELREAKMHQLVQVYSPDEIDTAGLKVNQAGEFNEKKLEERVQWIFGSAYSEWKTLNPNAYPAILYAPSVGSAKWFAEQFMKKGVPIAHIDGEVCLIPEGGKLQVYEANRETRQAILDMSESGEVAIVTNRFVLREAIDMPWLYHAIFATVMGSLTTFLQSVGRLQRYCPDYQYKILQCHGGSYWRHGSPNADRIWRLGVSAREASKERIEKIASGEVPEGIRCPKCGCWRLSGPVCANKECRHRHAQSVRAVRSMSGKLKLMTGKVFTQAPEADASQKLWQSILFRSAASDQSVASAVARFYAEARKTGLVVDLKTMRDPPPDKSSPHYDRKVRVVYPWTMKRRAKTSAKEQ